MVHVIAGSNTESVFGRTVNSGQSEPEANALAGNARSTGSTDQTAHSLSIRSTSFTLDWIAEFASCIQQAFRDTSLIDHFHRLVISDNCPRLGH